MSLSTRHIALTLCLACSTLLLLAQCSINSPVTIAPDRTTEVILEVDGLTLDDLANGQSVCAVYLEWEHGKQENLRIDLISPAGQIVTLAGPGIQGGNLSPGVNWNVSFVKCDDQPSPDAGIPATWDNAQAWQFLGAYTGSYFPNDGCLKDFDTGSAHGPWRLQITNLGTTTGVLIYFEIQFCDNTGIACDQCSLFAGEWDELLIPICESALGTIELIDNLRSSPELGFDDDFIFVMETPIGEYFRLEGLDTELDLSTFSSGNYTICGVAYDDSDAPAVQAALSLSELLALSTSGNCVAVSDDCFTLSIQASNELMEIERNLCPGTSIEIRETVYDKSIDTIFYSSSDPFVPCDTTWHIIINEVELTADIADQTSPVVCGQRLFLDGSASTSNVALISSYEWTTLDGNVISGNGPVAQIDQEGKYYLKVDDGFCNSLDSITITAIDTFHLRLEQQPAPCFEDILAVNFIDSFDITLGPVAYSITAAFGPPTSIFAFTNPPGLEASEPGEYIIRTEAGSCIRNDTIVLEPAGLPIPLTVTVTDTLGCDNQPVFFELMTDIIPTNITYDGPQLIAPNTTNPPISEAGMYTITIYDNNDCSAESTVEVIAEAEAPEVVVMDLIKNCNDQSSAKLTAAITGPTSDVVWTGPDGNLYFELEPTVTDTGIYVLTVTGENGCISTDNFLRYSITNDTVPWVGQDLAAEILCPGESVEVTLPSAILDQATAITWLDEEGSVIGMGDTQVYAAEGAYQALIEIPNSCTRMIPIEVTLNAEWQILAAVDLSSGLPECDSLSILNVDGDLAQIVAAYINGNEVELSEAIELPYNDFTFTLESMNGCTRDTMMSLPLIESPAIDLGPDLTLNLGESYILPSSPALPEDDWILAWSEENILSCKDCLDPSVTPMETTLLSLIVTNEDGCTAESSVLITVVELEEELEDDLKPGYYVPNVLFLGGFDPDNTLIMGLDTTIFNSYEFNLYDRWGSLIVAKQGPAEQSSITLWDGTFNGSPVNSGVYPYMAKLLHSSGLEQVISGQISLLR